jgi:hypothetical protein
MVDRAGLVFPDFGGECSAQHACVVAALCKRYALDRGVGRGRE